MSLPWLSLCIRVLQSHSTQRFQFLYILTNTCYPLWVRKMDKQTQASSWCVTWFGFIFQFILFETERAREIAVCTGSPSIFQPIPQTPAAARAGPGTASALPSRVGINSKLYSEMEQDSNPGIRMRHSKQRTHRYSKHSLIVVLISFSLIISAIVHLLIC